ncbi:maleylpyruvate isomerase family mycothiol-dependent enzyme [Streptosporangium subroseum]|uniref:maleylpyruvate isomerase family mycothiol-dependent enzyme n=1 Tax=Streptosporangium subroseum TaxID=106412 RepID=UPI003091CB98|nr:maleylpyruvate isomerase family mycothiol-dependent enzyme [Streptosporangium subroseum]
MTPESKDPLADLDPFDIFDAEAARLDRHFSGLDDEGWNRPSRCEGWSVRDILGHLAGEELYNHACLDGDLDGFFAMLSREGAGGGFNGFNQWCVRQRRDMPVEEVLEEWRRANAETRERMRSRGRAAELQTSAGPYPVGLQAFHYDSEYATHADDVGAPVSSDEAGERTRWRARVGEFVLGEQGSGVRVGLTAEGVSVRVDGMSERLPADVFVDATVGRLPDDHPLDGGLKDALRCLA